MDEASNKVDVWQREYLECSEERVKAIKEAIDNYKIIESWISLLRIIYWHVHEIYGNI